MPFDPSHKKKRQALRVLKLVLFTKNSEMENFVDKLCRLCLKESEDTADLFDYKNGHLIADLIRIICPVTIERNESEKLPSKVCVDCLELVVDAIHLRDLSIINDQELRGSLTLCPDVKCEEIEECEEIYVEALDEASLEIEKLECTQYLLVTSDVESLVIPSKAVSNSSYCHVCSETFCNQSSLKRHQLRKHKNVEYTCDLCDTSFKTKRDIEVHMRREHRRNQGVRFLYSEKLNVDLSDMYEKLEEPEGMVCSFCSYVDYDEVSLNEHLTTHQEVVDSGKMYCIHCPSPIDTMQFMISHTRTHNEKLKTHRCRICNKTFPFDDKFINHLRNHRKNQNKICFCPECGKKFSKPRMLDDHIRFIHNKESMFCCNQCGQNFGSKSALNGHIRRHVEGQKYQCPFCPKTFSSHNLLNSHKTVHSTERVRKYFKLQITRTYWYFLLALRL